MTDLPILFEDAEALVIDKPAGLDVTTPRRGGPCVEAMLGTLRLGFARAPTILHRLDKDTSGCLLLARSDRAHKRLQQAFEGGLVKKTYHAIVEGVINEDAGLIDLALSKVSSREAGWRIVPDPKGKAARTHWRVLDRQGGRTMIEFTPETGRTHQLRVHALAGLGLPIWGDPVYGQPSALGMLLHAVRLEVPRPGKEAIRAEAPWPERFTRAGFAP
ncbi:MAG: RluA family pseudouridine synthase [Sphingomonadales bacterium]|jgi:tRNA pseudouridine32 synthase/23S rRNA pseudouridine746 synthase|nr:RluA family pseudouridine synthase [Sphingomonadales bacterium]